MPFTTEEKTARRWQVIEAMGGWFREDEIDAIISDKEKLVRNIEFYQKQIDDLENEFDKPGMNHIRASYTDKIQARNKKFLVALRAFLPVLEKEV